MGGAGGEDHVVRLPPPALIPVLVTGIQSTRVRAAGESFQPKDLGWLDSCDKHRNEGGESAVFLMRPNWRNLLHVR
ncbi:hypothetical protein AGR7A_Cc160020 [Agrobacterium deltaense NCPPB 1641]|uniref:Uncharacterized protein n=1 Tax=Agrobacterium deltaense NCPPB 1641 TaxID=1183425 RepID=A0A1S7TKB9_9HYPH|nr:hypothetical protein AGR7A_Cc160020 [Agrobacterium deltaense NCPPB 1641]